MDLFEYCNCSDCQSTTEEQRAVLVYYLPFLPRGHIFYHLRLEIDQIMREREFLRLWNNATYPIGPRGWLSPTNSFLILKNKSINSQEFIRYDYCYQPEFVVAPLHQQALIEEYATELIDESDIWVQQNVLFIRMVDA